MDGRGGKSLVGTYRRRTDSQSISSPLSTTETSKDERKNNRIQITSVQVASADSWSDNFEPVQAASLAAPSTDNQRTSLFRPSQFVL